MTTYDWQSAAQRLDDVFERLAQYMDRRKLLTTDMRDDVVVYETPCEVRPRGLSSDEAVRMAALGEPAARRMR